MYDFKNAIAQELENLRFIAFRMKSDTELEGTLIHRYENGHEYFYNQRYIYKNGTDGKPVRMKKITYLGTASSPSVKRLKTAKFNYIRKKIIEADIRLLENLNKKYADYDAQTIEEKMPITYRGLPYECTEDSRIRDIQNWAKNNYKHNPREMSRRCITIDGTAVRSKGECIWYDTLIRNGIPFRYEQRIELVDANGYAVQLYPDFVIMCCDGRQLVIEHLGMLTDDGYMENFKKKIRLYLLNDLVIGENLFLTSDNIQSGINSQIINMTAERIIKPLVFGSTSISTVDKSFV